MPQGHSAYVERTSLAWRRTGLALFALAVVIGVLGLGAAAVAVVVGSR